MYRTLLPLVLAAGFLSAQAPPMVVPQASPRAQASQTVGLTQISVSYGRPGVQGRKVWGGLVPYGEVWRAGANENTVVTFSTPVKAGAAVLPAGSYGLHMIPTPGAWTVIFSTQSHAWGSYGYDPAEDAARLAVTPLPGEDTERLAYTFDDLAEGGVTLSLRWEKLRVPIRLEVDTPQVVAASLREQLRGQARFTPEGWAAAAAWCAQHGTNLSEARVWIDRSLEMRETFGALRTKALLLERAGDARGAADLRARALAVATENDLNLLGYAHLGQGRVDEALAVFQRNVEAHPGSWNAYDSLAEGCAAKGDRARAVANYTRALELVKAEDQRRRIRAELDKLR